MKNHIMLSVRDSPAPPKLRFFWGFLCAALPHALAEGPPHPGIPKTGDLLFFACGRCGRLFLKTWHRGVLDEKRGCP